MHAFYAKDKKSINSEKIGKLENDLTKTKKEKIVLQKTIKELKDEINKINLETVNKDNEKIKAEEEKIVLQKTIKELKDEINKINLETVNKDNEKIKDKEEKKDEINDEMLIKK